MDHREQTILDLQNKLRSVEAEAEKIKTTINYLCELSGEAPMYPATGMSQSMMLRGDEYHGRPLATVVTDVLNRRKLLGMGPAEAAEIFDDLVAGGFESDAKTEPIAKRNLAISMSKNLKFYRLPNGKWGLREWYPDAKESRAPADNGKSTARESGKVAHEAAGEEQTAETKEDSETERATDAV